MKNYKIPLGILAVLVVVYIIIQVLNSTDKSKTIVGTKEQAVQSTVAKQIDYEILKRVDFNDGLTLEVLVSEQSAKSDVMALARSLKKEHSKDKKLYINIFDSKDAYKNRDNINYPEAEYSKHWLVAVSINKYTGHEALDWVAEGRDH